MAEDGDEPVILGKKRKEKKRHQTHKVKSQTAACWMETAGEADLSHTGSLDAPSPTSLPPSSLLRLSAGVRFTLLADIGNRDSGD